MPNADFGYLTAAQCLVVLTTDLMQSNLHLESKHIHLALHLQQWASQHVKKITILNLSK